MKIASYIIGFFPVLLWFILKTFPPLAINKWYGYRTKNSLLNQQTWNEANRYSSQFYLPIGILSLCAAFGSVYAGFKNPVILTAMVTATLMLLVTPLTEAHLKKVIRNSKNL